MTQEKTAIEFKPYILINSFYHYLHIQGGSGNWKGKTEKHLYGGEFNYIVFYASPTQMEGLDKCVRLWCIEKEIPYGIGDTIEDAYDNYAQKIK